MYYYKLILRKDKPGEHCVYFRSPMEHSLQHVPKAAVISGDLCDAFLSSVDEVKIITKEEYYTYMYD